MVRHIRVSDGWTYTDSCQVSLNDLFKLTQGIEASFTKPDRIQNSAYYDIPNETSLSIHLPTPDSELFEPALDVATSINHPIESLVCHPVKTIHQDYTHIDGLTIENLDSRTSTKHAENIFTEYFTEGYRQFTIDIQHLVEHYTVHEAISYIQSLPGEILQFHVSGRTKDERHVLVSDSPENKKDIIQLLAWIAHSEFDDCDWVIEGKYTTIRDIRRETQLLSLF